MPLNDIIHTTTAVKHSRTFSEPKELVTRGKNILYTSRENISWTLKGIKRIVPIPCHPTLVRIQMVLPSPPPYSGKHLQTCGEYFQGCVTFNLEFQNFRNGVNDRRIPEKRSRKFGNNWILAKNENSVNSGRKIKWNGKLIPSQIMTWSTFWRKNSGKCRSIYGNSSRNFWLNGKRIYLS